MTNDEKVNRVALSMQTLMRGLLRKAYGRPLATLTERQDRALQAYIREVFAAGRTEGEKARRAAPAKSGPGVESRRTRAVDFAIQLLASVTTLIGMKVGSTTLMGAEFYLVSTIAWCAISWRKSLHGVWPLNIAGLVVTLLNLWSALA